MSGKSSKRIKSFRRFSSPTYEFVLNRFSIITADEFGAETTAKAFKSWFFLNNFFQFFHENKKTSTNFWLSTFDEDYWSVVSDWWEQTESQIGLSIGHRRDYVFKLKMFV